MLIRKATLADSKLIAELLFLAMQDFIYEFIGTKDPQLVTAFLLYFVGKENNQYSYTNCLVAERDHEIVGAVNLYDGANLEALREPIKQYIQQHFGIDLNPENETQLGEYYLDSIGVSAKHQGKGIGRKLLEFIIDKYANQKQLTIGLLVEEDNPNAEKLYLKVGFEVVGRKTFAGKQMKHLQLKPKTGL